MFTSQNDWKHLAGEEQSVILKLTGQSSIQDIESLTSNKTSVHIYVFNHLSLELNSILHRNTKYFCMTFSIHSREGNDNQFQYSCLENPRDGRAWWAAVYGVAELDTTEVLSSSSIHRIFQQCNFNINCGEVTLLSGEFISLLQFLF